MLKEEDPLINTMVSSRLWLTSWLEVWNKMFMLTKLLLMNFQIFATVSKKTSVSLKPPREKPKLPDKLITMSSQTKLTAKLITFQDNQRNSAERLTLYHKEWTAQLNNLHMLVKLLTTSNKDLMIELLNVMLFKLCGKNSTIIFQPSLVLVENLSILWKIKERSLLDMDYDHKSDFISFIINTKEIIKFSIF